MNDNDIIRLTSAIRETLATEGHISAVLDKLDVEITTPMDARSAVVLREACHAAGQMYLGIARRFVDIDTHLTQLTTQGKKEGE